MSSSDRTRDSWAEATAVDEARLAGALVDEAEHAGPLERVDVPRVLQAATRRRRRRKVRAGVVSVAVVGAVVTAVALTGAEQGHEAPPGGGEKARVAGPQEPGYFTCGQKIPWDVVGARSDGLTLTADSLRRDYPDGQVHRPSWASPDGPPILTYRLESERNVGLDPTQIDPTVLILRDGVVIGGPMPAEEKFRQREMNYANPAIGAYLYGPPYQPWPVMGSRQATWWLCDLADWDELWANPERYSVAVVMTPLSIVMRWTEPYGDFTRLDRPLMMAEIPLSAVQ